MNHVLEHVQHPVTFLRDVRRLLTPGGLVHIAVPNVACWQARLFGWTSYEPYHLAYFDPFTLVKAVEHAALAPIKVSTRDSFSGWFLAVLRTVLSGRRERDAVATSVVPSAGSPGSRRHIALEHAYRTAMVFAGAALWPLRWLQGKLGYGDEVICMATKKSCVLAQK